MMFTRDHVVASGGPGVVGSRKIKTQTPPTSSVLYNTSQFLGSNFALLYEIWTRLFMCFFLIISWALLEACDFNNLHCSARDWYVVQRTNQFEQLTCLCLFSLNYDLFLLFSFFLSKFYILLKFVSNIGSYKNNGMLV